MAAAEGDYETAAEYLDLRNLRGEARELSGAQLARRFSVVLQRGDWSHIDELTDDPAGSSNDNLPDFRDSIGVILEDDKEVRLYLQKVPRGGGVFIWKISNATVSLIPRLYQDFGYPEAVENLRRMLPDVSFLGYELFKWIIVLTVGVFTYGLVLLVANLFRRLHSGSDSVSQRRTHRFLVMPFGIWLVVMTIHTTASMLGRSAIAEEWQRMSPVAILVTVWILFAGMNLARDIYSNYLYERGRQGVLVVLHPAANAIKVLIVVIAILVYLDKLGINITTMLAGLGIGGLAVALALQRTMEDLLGAIELHTQQPVRVGDFCRIGGATGTVEEIGLRTTRIRTLAHSLIAVPNHRLVREPIDNISARGNIRHHQILRLRCDATPQQLQEVLEGIQELLSSHERVLKENQRVRFIEFAEHSLSIEVNAYLATTDWNEFLELAEQLNLRILEIVSRAGTGLFMPASSLVIEQNGSDVEDIGTPA